MIGGALAAATLVARAQSPAWRWREPGCFAYSPSLDAYACILMEARPNRLDEDDVSSLRLDDSYAVARRRGAEIAVGVLPVTVGAPPSDFEPLWRSTPDPELTPVSREALGEWLAKHGFTRHVRTHRVLLAEPDRARPGTLSLDGAEGPWVRLGRAAYRFETYTHEGSASFEVHGRLFVRCTPTEEPKEILTDERLGGPLAMLSKARGTTTVVLTIEHHDGGEGYVDVAYQHFAFDEAAVCGDVRG